MQVWAVSKISHYAERGHYLAWGEKLGRSAILKLAFAYPVSGSDLHYPWLERARSHLFILRFVTEEDQSSGSSVKQ